ncbi:hypothetical protein [Allostreptomyces psammosilenae]|uniref:Uncharacterized protein n=1 Tax=Allostreptomyces psammosilenae TaxID=1892865 RepID=A0A852ZTE7_9ACTN|nr:hypothetical protein [Allostreptomyces psammosilenae]NYI05686.1 hypothetical protein [Allostreptomyces psammosilenae]
MSHHRTRRTTAGRLALTLAVGLVTVATSAAPAFAEAARWRSVIPPLSNTILGDVDSAGGATWAVGGALNDVRAGEGPYDPVALRWTGNAWEATEQPVEYARLYDLDVLAPDDVWAVGTAHPVEGSEYGSRALVQHWDGTRWEVVDVPLPEHAFSSLDTVAATEDGTVWVTGTFSPGDGTFNSVVLTRTEEGAWESAPGADALGYAAAVLPLADDSLYAVGDGVKHFDGEQWSEQELPAHLDGALFDGIAARGEDDVWAVGHLRDEELWRRPVVVHFDGERWREVPTPAETGQLFDVTIDGNGRPVAVGETQDSVADPDGDYILTLGRDGRFHPAEEPAGAGWLYGATTDERGRVWVVGRQSSLAVTPEDYFPAFTAVRG